MSHMTSAIARVSPLLAVAALASGCSDVTGAAGTGAVQVTLQRMGSPSTQIAPPLLSVSGGDEVAAAIDLANVLCLNVQVTGIHFLPVVEDNVDPDMQEEDQAQWVRLDIAPFVIDLVNLPGDGEDPVVIAFDPAVEAGEYRMLRFVTGDMNEIFFQSEIQVGPTAYANDPGDCSVGHPVKVPSGSQSGLKTDIAFSVADAQDANPQSVDLLFDETTSVRNAVATGSGWINLTPVLRSRP